MSFLLKLLWGVLLLCLLILAAATVGLAIYQDEIETKLAERVKEATGRELQIQGGFGFKFNPLPTVSAKNIVLSNAPWGTKPWMLEIKQVEAAFSFIALAQGKLKVSNIKVDSPYFLFERKQDTLNWFFGSSKKGKSPKPLEKLYKYLLLDKALMDNAQFDIRINPRAHFIQLNRVTAEVDPIDQTIALDVVGSAENRVIQAKAVFTDVKSLLLREASIFQLSGTYGDMPVTAQGTVEDILRWQGLNATVKATAPSLKFFQPWNRVKLPDTPPIVATARFLQPGRWASAHLEEIHLVMKGYGGTTTMSGTFDKLQSWKGLSLDGTSNHLALPLLENIGWAGSQDAKLSARYTLSGDIFKGLTLNLEEAELVGKGLSATAKGVIDNLSATETSAIKIDAQAVSLQQVGKLVGRPWPLTSPIQATAQLAKKEGVYGLADLSGQAYDGGVSLIGEINNIGPFATGFFEVQGSLMAKDIAALNQLNGYVLPEADSTIIAGNINYSGQVFSASDATADLKFGESTISATGAVDNLAVMQLSGTNMKIDAPTVSPFNTLYKLALPELGHLVASATLSGNLEDKYTLNNIIGNINSGNHSFDIKGLINDLGKDMLADIEVVGEAKKLDDFQPNLQTLALPINTGVAAKFNLSSTQSNNWSVGDLQADLLPPAEGQIKGGVFNFPLQTEYQINVDIKSINIDNLQQLADIKALKGRNIIAKGFVNTEPGKDVFSADNIDVLITQPNTTTALEVTGSVGDMATFSGLNLKGHLIGDDFISVPEFSGLDFKPSLPFDIKFDLVRKVESNELDFNISQASVADSDLSGDIRFHIPESENTLPYINGSVQSSNLNVIDLMTKNKGKKLFSDTPFSLDWARSFNANIDIDVEDLNGLIANIKNAKGTIKLDQGFLTFPGIVGTIGEGELVWWLAIDSNTLPYNIITSMQGAGLDSKKLNLFGDSGLIKDGLIDVDMGVSGQGTSISQMMGTGLWKVAVAA